MLNIYQVTRSDYQDWDQYGCFIVLAETEERALELSVIDLVGYKHIYQGTNTIGYDTTQYDYGNWHTTLVGVTTGDFDEGIICEDFKRG